MSDNQRPWTEVVSQGQRKREKREAAAKAKGAAKAATAKGGAAAAAGKAATTGKSGAASSKAAANTPQSGAATARKGHAANAAATGPKGTSKSASKGKVVDSNSPAGEEIGATQENVATNVEQGAAAPATPTATAASASAAPPQTQAVVDFLAVAGVDTGPRRCLVCPICGHQLKGGVAALRLHQASSSRCLAAAGKAAAGRRLCPHGCGKQIAFDDAWALAQHEQFCIALADQPPTQWQVSVRQRDQAPWPNHWPRRQSPSEWEWENQGWSSYWENQRWPSYWERWRSWENQRWPSYWENQRWPSYWEHRPWRWDDNDWQSSHWQSQRWNEWHW